MEEGSFERARLVFFTGSPEFTRVNLAAARASGATLFDLSGGSLGEKETRLWHPRAEVKLEKGPNYAVLSAPATVAVALLDALNTVGLYRLGLIFFRPVSEAGRRGIEELESQTSQLLSVQSTGQAVFDTQVAFGMLNRYGAASRENLSAIRARICAEVSPLVGKRGVLPSIQIVHAPVFYGYTFAALAETASVTTREVGGSLPGRRISYLEGCGWSAGKPVRGGFHDALGIARGKPTAGGGMVELGRSG